jgi:hypothetical protein
MWQISNSYQTPPFLLAPVETADLWQRNWKLTEKVEVLWFLGGEGKERDVTSDFWASSYGLTRGRLG